jgi:6-pyruvoyltetrahydropterin/6-carboxytetrahydropterin synthase
VKADLIKSFQFEAAHRSPAPKGGDPKLHGHGYRVDIHVSGECDSHLGWLVDYGDISKRFDPLFRQLDHFTLEDVDGMDDTSVDGVRQWIVDRLELEMPVSLDVDVSIVGDCVYHAAPVPADSKYGLPPRIRFGFEAAHALTKLPETHKCRRMHGHSFLVEVGAAETMHLSDRLPAVYRELDHTCLNDIPGLSNPTSEQIARWIWNALIPNVSDLSVVVVAETCTARCWYRGT